MNRLPIQCLIGVWSISVVIGFLGLMTYQGTPGPGGSSPIEWPETTRLALDPARPSLLIFLHPRCPCSQASQTELARIALLCRNKVSIQVVSYTPDPSTAEWDRIAGRSVASIDGASPFLDRAGREAKRFGVRTSGHVLLFDPAGHTRFSGGITMSRGHEGANPGVDRLVEAIKGSDTSIRSSPVFGCPIQISRTSKLPETLR